MDLSYFMAPVVGYLFGSVPFGYLVARRHGINILEHGSGNIGATNVSRVLGKKPGLIVFVLDLLKGTGGVIVSVWITGQVSRHSPDWSPELAGLLGGVGAILGHNFTMWLKFRGGKGIATTAGVLFGLTPWTAIILISTWGILFKATRYVSLASIAAAAIMPFVTWFVEGGNRLLVSTTAVLGVLAIWRHRANIQRLLNGTENRFGSKPSPSAKENHSS